MKKGDIYNWAYAVLGILMLFMAATIFISTYFMEDKYMGAMLLFAYNFWGGIISIVVTGIFSAIIKRSVPILGALFGIALFLAVNAFSMAAFVGFVIICGVLNVSDPLARIIFKAGYTVILLGVPVVSFGFAFFRKPKEFQQSVAGYGPQAIATQPPPHATIVSSSDRGPSPEP
jgi:hypothetical protein